MINGNLEWVLRNPFALLNRMDRISLIERVSKDLKKVRELGKYQIIKILLLSASIFPDISPRTFMT